ncbi:hypothetical protein PVAND_016074 [Polypedilum vanderplanki]|uniref:Uncharacterized protein n=1 Tax=Polypedilum vanderplanki TaxID=319348 RepID=A0A9J6BE16_POLVA|nr:hypothetical protein PVAND_016074 [Polypedilum vanderplanki]
MGSTTSKTKSTTISPLVSTKRASKRILKRNSAIYPTTQTQNVTSDSVTNGSLENNNNNSILNNHTSQEDTTVVIRNKNNTIGSNGELPTTPKKEKKKKKGDTATSGDETAPTYHQTNVCYYKVENGRFLKLPSDTKHKSNDGCYVKLSNGSFRHLMVPDGAGSRPEVNFKPDGGTNNVNKKDVRQSMPVPPKSVIADEKKDEKNRKVMVTMIDGGLPVVAVSKRDKTANLAKKEKIKLIDTKLLNSSRIVE